MLCEIYGNTWELVHGDSSSTGLVRFANSLDAGRIGRVLEHCREEIARGGKFAPHLGQLIVFADEPTEREYLEIMARVQANEPSDRLETWLCENIRFNLRRIAQGREIDFLKSEYRKAQSLEKSGKLKTQGEIMAALPKVSAVNLNDIHRERFSGELNPRIKKIINSRKPT